MSDDPPDQPKRWRGVRRPPSRLATATTLLVISSAAAVAMSGCTDDEPDDTRAQRYASSGHDASAGATTAVVSGSAMLAFDRMNPSRPWFDTLPEIDRHPEHHAPRPHHAQEPTHHAHEPTVSLPPVRVPAMPPPTFDTRRASPETPRASPETPRSSADRDRGEVASSGILERTPREPSWPDSVGRLLPRRLDDPDRVTIENYFLYLPPGIETGDREWPVLIYLHGRSLRGDDLDLVTRYGIPSLLARGRHLPFIVLAPQLPDGQHWVDADRAWKLLEEAVLDRYAVDEDRIYLTGFSMGGGGAWRFAARHADRLAAAVPISASTPPPSEAWTDALSDLPMLVYHGDEDPLAPYEPAVAMVEHLREAGQEIDLITLEGEGHGIVQDVYRDPQLYVWLLAHER